MNADILLTKRSLIMRNRPAETRTYDLSGVQEFWVDSARIHGWLESSRYFVAPVFYGMVLVFSFLYRVAQVALYAAVGILFARSMNAMGTSRTWAPMARLRQSISIWKE